MEEFDFDLNNDIGTSVSQLRSKSNHNNEPSESTHLDTEFDYDKVMEHFNSEQSNTSFNYDTNRDTIMNNMSNTLLTDKTNEMFTNVPHQMNENRPRKQQNMNRFVRSLESNLDNFDKVNLNHPLPVNFTKQMIPKQAPKQKIIETMVNYEPKKQKQEQTPIKEQSIIQSVKDFFIKIEFREVIILMLLFMVLNNKIVIELIYDKIPYMNIIDSPYPNLIFRTLFFGIALITIKKFNL